MDGHGVTVLPIEDGIGKAANQSAPVVLVGHREQLRRALDSYQARLQTQQEILSEANSLILVPCV